MKPTPRPDFSISVRRQTWEESPEVAHLYEGILEVTLNHSFSVMFVPHIEPAEWNWPPELPEDLDEITTITQARLATILVAKYSVTPSARRYGEEEQLTRDAASGDRSAVFYVAPEEFARFGGELARLADERPAVHRDWLEREVGRLAVYRFLRDRVLESPLISASDLALVGR